MPQENRVSRRRLLAYFAGSTLLSGCLSSDSNNEGVNNVVPETDWTFKAAGEVFSNPVLVDNLLLFGSNDGYLYALEEEGGDGEVDGSYKMFKRNLSGTNSTGADGIPGEVQERWKFPTNGIIVGNPAVWDGNVFFGSKDNFFYSISAEDGSENWRLDTGGAIGSSSPSVQDGLVYFGSGHSGAGMGIVEDMDQLGRMYAVDAEDGSVEWSNKYDAGIQSSPVVNGDMLYFGCQDHNLYSLDSKSGKEIWSFVGDSVFCASRPALEDGVVYAGGLGGYIYAVDGDEGELLWEFKTEDAVVNSPVAVEDRVYFGSNDGNIYSVDSSGEEIWRFETGGRIMSSPAYRNGILYVGSMDGNLYSIDAETGEAIWAYPTEGTIVSTPIVAGNKIVFGSSDQRIYSVESNPVDQEKYDDYRNKLRQRLQSIREGDDIVEDIYGDEV